MPALVWWTSAVVLIVASGIDLRTRRVPNWLAVPFLVGGLATQSIKGGLPGSGRSLAGVALACLVFGVPWFIGAMGMGDLKLAAGVGAWIGPAQFVTASVFTALAGGVLAVGWALWHGALGATAAAFPPHSEKLKELRPESIRATTMRVRAYHARPGIDPSPDRKYRGSWWNTAGMKPSVIMLPIIWSP